MRLTLKHKLETVSKLYAQIEGESSCLKNLLSTKIHEKQLENDSPQQNGVVERGMRTQAERAQALLISSGLPRFLWEEAMKHSTWLQNRIPARALNRKNSL